MEEYAKELILMGARMRQIRKSKGLKLLDLEASTGIYDSEISRIERGLVNVEVQTVYRIAKALKVEIKDIFDYNGPPPHRKREEKRRLILIRLFISISLPCKIPSFHPSEISPGLHTFATYPFRLVYL
jgi:transcriptional regulator with XRE-family HTH domain